MSSAPRPAFIVDAVRTPVGRHGGALASFRPDDLGALVVAEIVRRTGADPNLIDDVILGCANQAGEDNRNVGRMSALLAGLPVSVPGMTVNRLCGSGLAAVIDAARAVASGEADLVIAGGVESMTRAPLVTAKASEPWARGNTTSYDTTLGWRFVNPRMDAMYGTHPLGETAELVAEMYKVGREEQDAFALESQRRWAAAQAAGRFAAELCAVEVPTRKGLPRTFDVDEHPRPETTRRRPGGVATSFSQDRRYGDRWKFLGHQRRRRRAAHRLGGGDAPAQRRSCPAAGSGDRVGGGRSGAAPHGPGPHSRHAQAVAPGRGARQ